MSQGDTVTVHCPVCGSGVSVPVYVKTISVLREARLHVEFFGYGFEHTCPPDPTRDASVSARVAR